MTNIPNAFRRWTMAADDFISKPPIAEELLARLRTANRVTSMQYELLRLATIDFLTGLSNRRGFFENAAKVVISAQHGSDLSAIMLDLDHFKQINDTHGHEIGDVVLERGCCRDFRQRPEFSRRLSRRRRIWITRGREYFGCRQSCSRAKMSRRGIEDFCWREANFRNLQSRRCSSGKPAIPSILCLGGPMWRYTKRNEQAVTKLS